MLTVLQLRFLGSKEIVKSLFCSDCKGATTLIPWPYSGEMPSPVLTGTLMLPYGLVGSKVCMSFFLLNC